MADVGDTEIDISQTFLAGREQTSLELKCIKYSLVRLNLLHPPVSDDSFIHTYNPRCHQHRSHLLRVQHNTLLTHKI